MADKKLKKKYQQAPKERKFAFIGLPFVFIAVLCMIPIMIGVGIIPCLIIVLLCFTIFIILFVMSKKEHKKWVEEGNKEYRYYDPDTGLEVDENGNPLPEGGEAPQKPAPVQEPQIQEPNLPEPDENGDIAEPAPAPATEPAPQPQPQPQAQPQQRAKYESPFVDFVRQVVPIIGFGLFALVALLRTIMFIRDMVYFIQINAHFTVHILNAIRIIGPVILLAVIIISLVKYFKEKQSIEKAYASLLKIAFLSAIIGIVGLVYEGASLIDGVYDVINILVNDGSMPKVLVEMFIRNFVAILFYVAFDIALIVFYVIALNNKVDSIKNKVFAVMPFGIMFIICIMFMIVTNVTTGGVGYPGFYVTASILMLACAAVGLIPFFVPFKNEPLGGKVAAAPASAGAATVAAAPTYQEPKYEEPAPQKESQHQQAQPQKKNNDSGDPEVKSNKKGLLIILIVVAALVLCGGGGVGVYFLIKNAQNNQNREDGPNDDSNPSSKSSSKSSSNSSSKSSSSSAKSYTASTVIAEIDRLNTGSATHYYLEDDIYYLLISYGAEYASESNLRGAVVSLSMPSYLTARSDPYSGTWGDGAKGYFQYLDTPKKDVTVYIGSYIYSTDEGDDLIAQVAVYNN